MVERFQFTALTVTDLWLVLAGLEMTLFIFLLSTLIGSLAGLLLALALHRRVPVLSHLARIYVETFRNSPLLVQLFLVFFGLPSVTGIRLSPVEAGLLTLSVNTAAFMCVIIHAALEAVPKGQWEAARAFGHSYWQSLRFIALPQALRTMIAPTIVLCVDQLQVSSLCSIIGVIELTKVGSILNTRTLNPFLIWPLVALLYFAISKPLSMLADAAERRMKPKNAWTGEARGVA